MCGPAPRGDSVDATEGIFVVRMLAIECRWIEWQDLPYGGQLTSRSYCSGYILGNTKVVVVGSVFPFLESRQPGFFRPVTERPVFTHLSFIMEGSFPSKDSWGLTLLWEEGAFGPRRGGHREHIVLPSLKFHIPG